MTIEMDRRSHEAVFGAKNSGLLKQRIWRLPVKQNNYIRYGDSVVGDLTVILSCDIENRRVDEVVNGVRCIEVGFPCGVVVLTDLKNNKLGEREVYGKPWYISEIKNNDI